MTPRAATVTALLVVLLVVLPDVPLSPPAFGSDGNADDETFLERYARTYRFRLGRPVSPIADPGGNQVLFLRSGPRDFVRDLWALDLERGRERVVATAADLLGGSEETLTAEERARRERQRQAGRGITSFALSPDGERILIPLSGRLFLVSRKDGRVRELPGEGGAPIDPHFSPDGRRIAVVRDGDLYVIDVADGTQHRLTHGGGGEVTHGLAEFVAQEEMSRHRGYWWSPDSTRIAYQRTDTAALETMTIGDATRPEVPAQRWPYPRPGKPNADVRLAVVSLDDDGAVAAPPTPIEWDRDAYEYLAAVTWTRNAPLTLLVQNRTQTEQRLLAADPETGATRTLLVERDPAWLEIDETMPRWAPDGSAFLWTTERRGGWQLELRDADGSLRHEITPIGLGLRRVVEADFAAGEAIVLASDEPTETHVLGVSLDGDPARVRRFTRVAGVHGADAAGRGPLWVLNEAPLDGPARHVVMDRNGPTPHRLTSRAESPGIDVHLELRTVGASRRYRTAIVRPADFDPARSYPVIVHVYGGPTSTMVRASRGRYLLDQWIANHGYLVVAIDGRGTPHRGRDWQRVIKNDLIEVPLRDQVEALRLLAEEVPQMDAERVGIYGWSFGGYVSAMAVMRQPDVFRAGVAGAPVVDWRYYDTHYTERYMDLPRNNPEGYAAANVLTHAARLERPLLIVHGTADDNVYFAHSLQLADALFRAGRPFDFLPLPGFTHMVPDPLVTTRLYERILVHFDEALAESAPAGFSGVPAD